MAILKNNKFGILGRTISNVVYKPRSGVKYIASKPEKYNVIYTAIEKIKQDARQNKYWRTEVRRY